MKTPLTASSATDCKNQPLLFQDLGSRQVAAGFSGGTLSSDGGVLLLRPADEQWGVTRALAGCFQDVRDQRFVDHAVQEWVAQRVYGLARGYEDLHDHERLRLDPLLATACNKVDPLGADRFFAHHRGVALAGAATLNRLELSSNRHSRCHKLPHDPLKIQAALLRTGGRGLPRRAAEVVVDLDAMGHLIHGRQEGRHFSAYYGAYCSLPLYAFVGNIPLWAPRRTRDRAAAHGVVPAREQMVAAIRQRCRHARIILRGDSGFCREEIMVWCEGQREVYDGLGLAKNSVLLGAITTALAAARARRCLTGVPSARAFCEFEYRTVKSWSRTRRVIGKAEVMAAGDHPRFVVTNLPAAGFKDDADKTRFTPARLYEELYCARGEMENVLQQPTLDWAADRLSTHYLASNQLRLWLATFACLWLERVRTMGLAGTEWAAATAGSVRLKLLKVAAAITVRVRRVYVQWSSAHPLQELFGLCQRRRMAATPATG